MAPSGALCLSLALAAPVRPPGPLVLANGLRIVYRERTVTPLVAIDVWMRAGAREEHAGEAGAAHFLEHVLFKGTSTRPPGETDVAIENLGGALDAATGPDAVHFYTTVPSDRLDQALGIIADFIRNATVPQDQMDLERGVILDELAQHDADPTARVLDTLYSAAFGDHLYGASPGGAPADFRLLSRASLISYYRRLYRPDRCTVAVVGSVSLNAVRSIVTKWFGDWARSDVTLGVATAFASGAGAGRAPARAVSGTGDGGLCAGIAFVAPRAADAQLACAGRLAAAILATRLSRWRRAQPELKPRIDYVPRADPSLFAVTVAAEQGQATASALQTLLESAVRALWAGSISEDELRAARRLLLGRQRFDTETDSGMARAIGYADVVGGDTPEQFEARARTCTPADVETFVRDFLNPDHAVRVVVAPKVTDAP